MILLFGDHQPQVATNFYTDVLGTNPDTATAQKKQMVPFVLWANYDIPEAQGVELSLNYLSALLMDTANLPMQHRGHPGRPGELVRGERRPAGGAGRGH